ncbi:MAG: hypothetical protein WKG06_08675 [Segetibacter sp.]
MKYNIQNIFNEVSGGKTDGLNVQGMKTKFKGRMDKDGDGDVDLQDLKASLPAEGGLVDKVKGSLNRGILWEHTIKWIL